MDEFKKLMEMIQPHQREAAYQLMKLAIKWERNKLEEEKKKSKLYLENGMHAVQMVNEDSEKIGNLSQQVYALQEELEQEKKKGLKTFRGMAKVQQELKSKLRIARDALIAIVDIQDKYVGGDWVEARKVANSALASTNLYSSNNESEK